MQPRDVWSLLRQSLSEWSTHNTSQLGASLAFYMALSIAPLLVISLRLAALFFGTEAAHGQLVGEMESLVGKEASEAIQEMIVNTNRLGVGIVTPALSVLTLFIGALGVFGQLQNALNTIWNVRPDGGRGLWGYLRDRFLSFTMVLGIACLLLVSLVLTAALAFLSSLAGELDDKLPWLAQTSNFVASFLVITLLFAMMYKVLPDVQIVWRDVWIGAVMTAALFSVGNFFIGLYLGRSNMASSYGAAGSFVILLVWAYYSAQILLFGAELTQVYANRHGSRIIHGKK